MKKTPSYTGSEPLLIRATRSEVVDRPPVWIMRQAGRYLPEYRALCGKYSFQQRCEIPELAIKISLQPFHRFHPDGVIIFSDILTPLTGMGITFDLVESVGPVIHDPVRTQAQVDRIRQLEPESALPFIREILTALRSEVASFPHKKTNTGAAILGFVGAPWTLATYIVEGKSSQANAIIKTMARQEPDLLHQLLAKLADSISVYACYQADCGAQVIQIFDSWAGQLSPIDYRCFALPYQQQIIAAVKRAHPNVPIVLYINGSAGLLEQVRDSGADVFGVDWMIDIGTARTQLGSMPVQGNLDPSVLLGSESLIRDRTMDIIRSAGPNGHILNLGHGIHRLTPVENVQLFFDMVQSFSYNN